jgi:hypothetical protein
VRRIPHRSPLSRVTPALSIAASVPVPMAMPMSAAARSCRQARDLDPNRRALSPVRAPCRRSHNCGTGLTDLWMHWAGVDRASRHWRRRFGFSPIEDTRSAMLCTPGCRNNGCHRRIRHCAWRCWDRLSCRKPALSKCVASPTRLCVGVIVMIMHRFAPGHSCQTAKSAQGSECKGSGG